MPNWPISTRCRKPNGKAASLPSRRPHLDRRVVGDDRRDVGVPQVAGHLLVVREPDVAQRAARRPVASRALGACRTCQPRKPVCSSSTSPGCHSTPARGPGGVKLGGGDGPGLAGSKPAPAPPSSGVDVDQHAPGRRCPRSAQCPIVLRGPDGDVLGGGPVVELVRRRRRRGRASPTGWTPAGRSCRACRRRPRAPRCVISVCRGAPRRNSGGSGHASTGALRREDLAACGRAGRPPPPAPGSAG